MYKLIIDPKNKIGHINPELQGHFSEHLGRCIYEGLFVGEQSEIPNTNGMRNDVVNALKEMKLPVLRWPGGCFADEYHWKDGIGKKEARKKMVNTHWGGVIEDNSFGTHEYMELCRQLGCKTYVNGNVGSGTVQEMSEWVEYMTFEGISPMADLRKKNGGKPILHASVSAKWTMRSDRAQNSRTEALNLIRNRKGHLPHIVVVTGEPLPSRIASLAMGTGDVDCVYHFALYELLEAVREYARHGREDIIETLNNLVDGKRLKDISDLPPDLSC